MIRWTETIDGKDYTVLVCLDRNRAEDWAAALTYAQYDGCDWTVKQERLVIGHEPGTRYAVPSFDGVEIPDWAYSNA